MPELTGVALDKVLLDMFSAAAHRDTRMVYNSVRQAVRRPAPSGEDEHRVGGQIRDLRTARGLTLESLAREVGITRSALSQIERNQANPTLATLKALASALGITIGRLFPPPAVSGRIVVRRGDRKRLSPRSGITYELLTPDLGSRIEFILGTYERGASTGDEAFAYPAEQCGLVLQGRAEIYLSETSYRLEAGDSIRFDCSMPHRIVNAGRSQLRCLWAISPPTF